MVLPKKRRCFHMIYDSIVTGQCCHGQLPRGRSIVSRKAAERGE